jgi:hypothetical protein
LTKSYISFATEQWHGSAITRTAKITENALLIAVRKSSSSQHRKFDSLLGRQPPKKKKG